MKKLGLSTFFQKAKLSLGLEYLFQGVEQIVGSYHYVRGVKIALEKNLNEKQKNQVEERDDFKL